MQKNFYEKYPERSDEDSIKEALSNALDIEVDNIHLKVRDRQKGKNQYQRLKREKEYSLASEGNLSFLVNTRDLLDTGLFLDHRPLRLYLAKEDGHGKNFLNLFSYTSTVSVAAASAGFETTSVDMSNTYIEWSEANFQVNGLKKPSHNFIREDVFKYLEQEDDTKYDVIYLDPPTFSNSKKMNQILDIQKIKTSSLRLV